MYFEWIKVGLSDGGSFYIKSEALRNSIPNVIKIWTKTEYQSKKIENIAYKNCYSLSLCGFDCQENKLIIYNQIDYKENGDLIRSSDISGSWVDVIPGSIGEILYKEVCKRYNIKH